MPSDRVLRILRSSSPFSPTEIELMTDAQGWAWIYSNAKPKKEKLTQICFTGFSVLEKDELIALAKQTNLEVVTSVTAVAPFI
jgi:hypothetical protein